MLESLKRIFNKSKVETLKTEKQVSEHDVLVATCAIFVEMARIDEKFTPAEVDTIISILREKYGLSREHADALLAEADKELEESLDLWQFASLINKNYSVDEKIEIIETLWQMVFVDGKMQKPAAPVTRPANQRQTQSPAFILTLKSIFYSCGFCVFCGKNLGNCQCCGNRADAGGWFLDA